MSGMEKKNKPFVKALEQYVESEQEFYWLGYDFAIMADPRLMERLEWFVTGYRKGLEWKND